MGHIGIKIAILAFVKAFVAVNKPIAGDLPRALDTDRGCRGEKAQDHFRAHHYALISRTPARTGSMKKVVVDDCLVSSRKPDDYRLQ